MKNLWIAVVLTAAAFGATRHAADVVVYLHHGTEDASLIGLAEGQAQKMLASVGVAVEWRLGTPSYHGSEVIEAALVDQQDPAFRPGSLAFSTLGVPGGTRIQVFYNRVVAAGPAQLRPFILAMFWCTKSPMFWRV